METSRNEMAQNLKDSDVEVRLSALKSLVGSEEESSIESILDALGDSEWRVRKTAVAIALSLEDKSRVVDGLIRRFGQEKNVGMRNAAVEIFIQLGRACIDQILSHYYHADEDVKKFIIDSLGEIRDISVVPHLIACISESNENVQAAAIEALGKIKDERGVAPLIQILKKDHPLLSFSAIKALEQIGDVRAVEPILEILNKNIFKRAGLEALGVIGDMRAVGALEEALKSGTRNVRYSALKSLVLLESRQNKDNGFVVRGRLKKIYHEEIYSFLIDVLNDPDKSIKIAAIRMLGWVSEVKSIPAVVPFLNSEYRDEAFRSLVEMGRPAVDFLITELTKHEEKVRESIALILGEIGEPSASETLVRLLTDQNGHVRQAAAVGLGKIKNPATIGALLPILGDLYPDVQESALNALVEMKDSLSLSTLLELLKSPSTSYRSNAATLLGAIRNKEAIPPLSFLLKDPDEAARRTAVDALSRFDFKEVSNYLVLAFNDEAYKVRLAALKILEQKNAEEIDQVFDYLAALSQDDNIWVRTAVPRILAKLRGEKSLKLLITLLKDKVGVVKISAVAALGARREKGVLSSMVELTDDPDVEVRKAAILALGALGESSIVPLLQSFLSHSHWTMRASAARALGDLRDRQSLALLGGLVDSDEDSFVREAARFAVMQIEQDGTPDATQNRLKKT